MEDKHLKEILSRTQLMADENLKHRILHQIHTEKSLSPMKSAHSSTTFDNLLFIFGLMYAIIAILTIFFYISIESNPLKSTTFITSVAFVSSISSLYWLLTVYEDYRKHKQI
jgi:uncharacterized membrane protein